MSQPQAAAVPEPLEVHAVMGLTVQAFRNYDAAALETGGKSVVLTGANGAGKTSLLEAISFLAPGRGFRRVKLSEIDKAGSNQPWVVSAGVEGAQGAVQIGTGRDVAAETDRRLVRVNGAPVKGHAELAEYLSVIWLTPQMDALFNEGNTARRKFLDRLVYGFDSAHATRVNAYETAMRERNRLLADGRADAAWFASLEHTMAEHGTAIAISRLDAVSHINAMMQQAAHDFPRGEMQLSGLVERCIAEGKPALATEEEYRRALADSRRMDAQTGRTSVGVHKSELTVTHLEKQMEAAYCSTGEQKALLLSIILAEARASAHWHGRVPVVLLDEVAAHLDPARRRELYKEIQSLGMQSWMTGVSDDLFKEIHDNSLHFRVENGAVNI